MSRRKGSTHNSGRQAAEAAEPTVAAELGANQLVMSEASTVTERLVHYEDILVDSRLQMRATNHSKEYVEDLAEVCRDGRPLPPVVVFQDPQTGELRLVDGHARVDAHRLAGAGDVRVAIHVGDSRAAFEYALGANATHGARRTRADLRKAVECALADAEMKNWSNAKIADVCRCSDRHVGGVRLELEGPNGSDPTARRLGKDGRKHPAKKVRSAGPNGLDLTGQTAGGHTKNRREVSPEAGTHADDVANLSEAAALPCALVADAGDDLDREEPIADREPVQTDVPAVVVPVTGVEDNPTVTEVVRKTGEDIRWCERKVREVSGRIARVLTRLRRADAVAVRGRLKERRELGVLRTLREDLDALLTILDSPSEPTAAQLGSQEVSL